MQRSHLLAAFFLAAVASPTQAFTGHTCQLSHRRGHELGLIRSVNPRHCRIKRNGIEAPTMLVDPVVGFVGKSVIVGGALAGGLHAVSGPDHFPALLPRCMGQQLMPAAKIGSLWGLGHAMSAMAMGLAIFLLKERTISSHTALGKVAFGADIAIGLSLVFIGGLSLLEARGRDFKNEVVQDSPVKSTFAMKLNMMMNGIFHGLSLDGVPSLMPVLGAGSLTTAFTFLASYGLGCVVAMTMATVLIGKGTATLTVAANFDLGKLIRGSAYGAILIGVLWTLRAILIPA